MSTEDSFGSIFASIYILYKIYLFIRNEIGIRVLGQCNKARALCQASVHLVISHVRVVPGHRMASLTNSSCRSNVGRILWARTEPEKL